MTGRPASAAGHAVPADHPRAPADPQADAAAPLARRPDWQLRLAALVERRQAQPFAWGASDCCTWASDVVEAVTGHDPAADVRGTYSGWLGALVQAKERGGLPHVCAQRLGARVRPALAQPGDIGLAREGSMPMLVAHTGGCWMGQGPDGLVPVRPDAVVVAWRCC